MLVVPLPFPFLIPQLNEHADTSTASPCLTHVSILQVKPSGGKPSGAAAADADGTPHGPTSGGATGGAGPSSLTARKATAATAAAGPKPKDAAGPVAADA
eukprot:1156565-Pelagomonas_calceolata.AAC.6